VLVLALYRQVGVLTMRLGPGVALELAEEGPPVGDVAPELDRLNRVGDELVAFFSSDCRLCRAIAPGVRAFEREGMPVRTVYEHEEPSVFERWGVPGRRSSSTSSTGSSRQGARSTRSSSSTASSRSGAQGWNMPRPDGFLDAAARALSTRLASGMTRKSFLGRMGGAMLAATGGAAVAAAVRPEKSEAFHFCGHIWTTGSCLNPLGLPRIDKNGYPLRPSDGTRSTTSAARQLRRLGGRRLGQPPRAPDGEFSPRRPRTRLCEEWTNEHYGLGRVMQGAGTAAAAARCGSSSTAARTARSGSTATRP
jgi:hypothetical protein